MCAICGLGAPVCNLAGGCGVEMLDLVKVAGITGSAWLGIAFTTLPKKSKLVNHKQKHDGNKKQGK